MLQYKWPDDPIQIPPHALYRLLKEEPGTRVGQFKWDGYRRPAYYENGGWTLHAKHNEQKLPPPAVLMAALRAWKVPDGTALDLEWMGPRAVAHTGGRHWFKVFDYLYADGEWLGAVGFMERHQRLCDLFSRVPPPPEIELTDVRVSDLMVMFEESKQMPITEGIVVRHRDSGLVGSATRPTDNPLWNKVKWRQ